MMVMMMAITPSLNASRRFLPMLIGPDRRLGDVGVGRARALPYRAAVFDLMLSHQGQTPDVSS